MIIYCSGIYKIIRFCIQVYDLIREYSVILIESNQAEFAQHLYGALFLPQNFSGADSSMNVYRVRQIH